MVPPWDAHVYRLPHPTAPFLALIQDPVGGQLRAQTLTEPHGPVLNAEGVSLHQRPSHAD